MLPSLSHDAVHFKNKLWTSFSSEIRNCVKVKVAALGSVDIKQQWTEILHIDFLHHHQDQILLTLFISFLVTNIGHRLLDSCGGVA